MMHPCFTPFWIGILPPDGLHIVRINYCNLFLSNIEVLYYPRVK